MNNYLNNYNYMKNYSKIKNNNYQQSVNNYNIEQNNEMIKNNNKMNNDSLFDPYQGFIRGNMFQKLYDPYKLKEPYDIKPMNEQAELLTYIDSLSFACIDLNLYLDVYPNDRSAFDLFNQYRTQKNDLIEEYQNKFGPLLLNSDSLNTYPWAWDDRPWPWQS